MHHLQFKFIIAEGLKVTKIHRVLRFKQSNFLAPFIDITSEMRKKSTNDLAKLMWKTAANSVFGKFFESKKEQRIIKLKSTYEGRYGVQKMIADPAFKKLTVFNENMVAVEMNPTKILMDKPIFVAASILDISKFFMGEFYYNFIVKNYGDRVIAAYTGIIIA